ncbi:MAG: outer membrane lipoprotein-sorting protein [Bacteroidales bacterium]|nr:outer membrane lipoprotein-sorting protein [Bacteroidales bacterium]
MKIYKSFLFFGIFSFLTGITYSQNATEIIKKADKKFRGNSAKAEMTMTIVRPTWKRTLKFKTWGKGNDYSLALITYPPKEKGQTFLKRKNEMWTWNPKISRLIKMPPSLMSQGWMGSDYSNDDILKESSIVNDYSHKIIGSEKIDGIDCYKIELIPKEDAVVIWGKLIKWISKEEYNQMKSEYYDEDGYLVKTEISSSVKLMGNKKIPTHIEIIPAEEPNHKTIVDINSMIFDIPINDNFFSQQNMKRVK